MKTPFLIASLFLLLLWPALIEGKDKPEILLYLPFDEGKGQLTADESGLGNKTEIFKAKWVQGKFGKALEFNGKGHYARTKAHPSFAFKAKDEITVMAWIKQATAELGAIIYNRPKGNDCNFGFRSEGQGISWFYWGEDWQGVKSDPPNLIPLNKWVHIAATNIFGEGQKQMKVYINGKECKTVLGWGPGKTDPLSLKGPIDIGARWAGQDHLFNGVIDEVQIYRGIFSQKELQKIIQGPASEFLGLQPKAKLTTTWGVLKQHL